MNDHDIGQTVPVPVDASDAATEIFSLEIVTRLA